MVSSGRWHNMKLIKFLKALGVGTVSIVTVLILSLGFRIQYTYFVFNKINSTKFLNILVVYLFNRECYKFPKNHVLRSFSQVEYANMSRIEYVDMEMNSNEGILRGLSCFNKRKIKYFAFSIDRDEFLKDSSYRTDLLRDLANKIENLWKKEGIVFAS